MIEDDTDMSAIHAGSHRSGGVRDRKRRQPRDGKGLLDWLGGWLLRET